MEKITLVNSNESPLEQKARAAAELMTELLTKLESLRDSNQEFRAERGVAPRAMPMDSIREGYRQQLLRARGILVETIDSLDEDEARLSYQKLIVDCDPYLKEEDKSKEV